jgi:hypothetical protein
MARLQFLKCRVWIAPFLLTVLVFCVGQAPVPDPVTDQETELGREMYDELKDKGEIVESSPLYESLSSDGRRMSFWDRDAPLRPCHRASR